jgi:hypothetical protein
MFPAPFLVPYLAWAAGHCFSGLPFLLPKSKISQLCFVPWTLQGSEKCHLKWMFSFSRQFQFLYDMKLSSQDSPGWLQSRCIL